ncbi:hypothetical protein B0O80DRAFT_125201 [Mortierella sp. GBAus27b]|nr:hypothetical protein B0O80DRAFT_125201 [Mortierella sp. GBAus27b]
MTLDSYSLSLILFSPSLDDLIMTGDRHVGGALRMEKEVTVLYLLHHSAQCTYDGLIANRYTHCHTLPHIATILPLSLELWATNMILFLC